MATSIKVSVSFLKKKVEEAKAKYLKEYTATEAKYKKDLVTYAAALKAQRAAVVKAVQVSLKDPKNELSFDSYYRRVSVPVNGMVGVKDPGGKPYLNSKSTKPFDIKLSMLEGAVGSEITI